MTREIDQPNAREIFLGTPDGFVKDLFKIAVQNSLNTPNASIFAEINDEDSRSWTHEEAGPGGPVFLGAHIHQGLLVLSDDVLEGFALVSKKSRHPSRAFPLSFQFGFLQMGKKSIERYRELDPKEALKRVVGHTAQLWKEGEINIDFTNQVRVHSWTDEAPFGGSNVRLWPQEELLTPDGSLACLDIIQRTKKQRTR